ncbi:MAG: hydroxymethylglutaryl-CoA reductase, degradative [Candidatus Thermoplasmatota archaeon]|nr:hydroxymethylglutaryl-CoA reductase, degradative [Candidatus Thermoplasmatota archaeon]
MPVKNSELKGFYKKSTEERIETLKGYCQLNDEEISILENRGSLSQETGEKLVENYISNMEIPMGIATNFSINGRDYLIPMAIEEPSVIAACSNGARIARMAGGFRAYASSSIMFGQIQLTDLEDVYKARTEILMEKENILRIANEASKTLSKLGKGARDITFHDVKYDDDVLIIHLEIDTGDAMGANIINSMVEKVSPFIEAITGGKVVLKILSNLTPLRIVRAYATFRKDAIGGPEVVQRFIHAARLAEEDIFRAATHNKGIMNGIDAVLLAIMNDWRQAEANAHAYAAIKGSYGSLTHYNLDKNGDITGSIEIPISVGTVGGTSASIPKAKICQKILGVKEARELEEVLACVGLSQNFAAMRALSDEGIQKGHMALHSKNLAIAVGATGDDIEKVAEMLVKSGSINMTNAREILDKLRER